MFCIPYAGGSSEIYSRWKSYLPEHIEIHPIELSGRGAKIRFPLIDNMSDCVENLFSYMKDYLDKPYAIFGHSMGSLIAFELCRYIQNSGYPSPVHIFFSGRKAPSNDKVSKPISSLPEQEFIEEVCKYSGKTRRALENPVLASLFIPVLRADFKLCETYRFKKENSNLYCPISILYGEEDDSTDSEALKPWQHFSDSGCEYVPFPGGHFFINDYTDEVVNYVLRTMNR
ncbi:thioesterase II family protein [Paenibacillus sp. SI8]|uniref:thioesterase II family protein n=1 Tax=unclassified Paenibacillus TaxID=185978 RepID=UPI0034667C6C